MITNMTSTNNNNNGTPATVTSINNYNNNLSSTSSTTTTTTTTTSYTQSLTKSLTIDEMRSLHQQALTEAESKKLELRLVLASRYRELVGSSDDVIKMEKDANVLVDLVDLLPSLIDDLIYVTGMMNQDKKEEKDHNNNNDNNNNNDQEEEKEEKDVLMDDNNENNNNTMMQDRMILSSSIRIIHSFLDQQNVHAATTELLKTFGIIAKYTNQYQLVNTLIQNNDNNNNIINNNNQNNHNNVLSLLSPIDAKLLYTQIKMIYLHLQSIPLHTIQLSKQILIQLPPSQPSLSSSSLSSNHQQHYYNGAHYTARALSALHRLHISFFQYKNHTRSNKLLDLYFDSKATLIHSLLEQLNDGTFTNTSGTGGNSSSTGSTVDNDETDVAEEIISKIVWILQYDIILYPFQIFMLRKYHTMVVDDGNSDVSLCDNVMNTLPTFDHEQVRMKASNFLATHLPLIRSKVKVVLVGIAGTTASRLGSIRRSLYDKTDGSACISSLSSDGICTWDDAVHNIVDLRIVTRALDGLSSASTADTSTTSTSSIDVASTTSSTTYTSSSSQRKFSLWGTLFSNTFSSLVHSILSTSFHSVHRQVVATLRASLANAPSYTKILPHEAYRNTLRIASELDSALKKVSDDAHELLVHAEEREESERRLRQSLYVQTCEIMGRLLNELRRMLIPLDVDGIGNESKDDEDATKQLIIGRLCYLLKFRLTSLPTLLDPESSPAVLSSRSGGKVGMITVAELQSAFQIADVDDDGLINFDEAMEAMDGAFSGTQFHGAEMVRETMLLTSGSDDKISSNVGGRIATRSLTLSELSLLSARGLKHDSSGPGTSLGIIQSTLDDIVNSCFCRWSAAALSPYAKSCSSSMAQFVDVASTSSDEEWKRLHQCTVSDVLEEGLTEGISTQVGSVSSFVVSYFISVATLLNKTICPSDSLPPYPNNEYALAMGFNAKGKDESMVDTLRLCLLQESLLSITNVISDSMLQSQSMIHDDLNHGYNIIKKFGPSALTQLLLDIKFINSCFFVRNKYGFKKSAFINDSKEKLAEVELTISNMVDSNVKTSILPIYNSRIAAANNSCAMFFSSVFGEEKGSAVANGVNIDSTIDQSDAVSLIINPMPSSRRFALLPIQTEQSMKELQLLRNLEKERANKAEGEKFSGASVAANAVSSGIGYFSSLLKKK